MVALLPSDSRTSYSRYTDAPPGKSIVSNGITEECQKLVPVARFFVSVRNGASESAFYRPLEMNAACLGEACPTFALP